MSGPISTRNGVPRDASEAIPASASDPPGGIPLKPDPQVTPHPAPISEGEGEPTPQPGGSAPLPNEPPLQPPHREARRRAK